MKANGTTDFFVKYSFRFDDIEGGASRLLPKLFNKGAGMRRAATPSDQSLRAGFTRLCSGQRMKTYFWYKEIWYVIRGGATLKVLDKRTGKKTTVTLKPMDFLYFPEGVRLDLANNTKEDLYFLYCAVPASRRDAPWLAVMDKKDIKDIVSRQEFKR